LSGVVTDPPKGIAVPFTVIELLINALFGILKIVFVLPEIIQELSVLFVIVWVAFK
jgi:hypothetical protein